MTTRDPWRDALDKLGSAFMTSSLIRSTSKEAGMPSAALYFRGRVGVLGDVSVDTAEDVLGIFPRRVVESIWSRTPDVVCADAVESYVDVSHRWARENVVDDEAAARAADLLERVVDETTLGPAPLAMAFARLPRPDDVPARVVHSANVVREIRGGLYFGALALVGLPVFRAMLVDPRAGAEGMGSLGWKPEEIEAAQKVARPGDDVRWRNAEDALTGAFVGLLGDAIGEEATGDLAEALLAVRRVD
ncbi:hypothetical protein CLV56_4122 [Mumia flava]|uniref:Uncharacterized protein n=1 Tax=Mumia flava TaxID=1348852 RepID=A0A2M9AQD4_9ACTN|nr:hypothetical protein [Mumia flava]PJJ47863.1 hypothetical protein CLV56_4122 [Mumia flava]